MNNISYSDFKNICRMCMFSCDIKFTKDNVISNVFYKLTDIHFETNDELPQQICQKCFHKINEIHEFAFQCKQTHSNLLQCLNNFKNPRTKEEQDISEEMYKPLNIEEVIIDEHKIDSFKEEELSSASDYDIDEFEVKNDKNIEFEEIMISRTINDKNIDELMKQNTPNNEMKMRNQTRAHSGECPYKCKHCSKSFSRSAYLKTHMYVHSDKRPKKCDHCSKSFKQTTKLKIHMRTHTGERPYKCEQCPKSFTLSCNLNRHMSTHIGERPYKCEQCSKSFGQSSNLQRHIRMHNGERPYTCEHCSKTFSQFSNLQIHMRTHSGARSNK